MWSDMCGKCSAQVSVPVVLAAVPVTVSNQTPTSVIQSQCTIFRSEDFTIGLIELNHHDAQIIHAVQLRALPTACNDFKSSQTDGSLLLRLIRRIFIPYTIPGLCYNTYFVAGSTNLQSKDETGCLNACLQFGNIPRS